MLGKFKEELSGIPIEEVVLLRPKMYCIKSQNAEKRTAKGVNKTVVKEQLRFEQYKAVYEQSVKSVAAAATATIEGADQSSNSGGSSSNKVHYVNQVNFRSVRHSIQTVIQRKKALTIADTKRYWLDTNTSLPFGHWRVEELQRQSVQERADYIEKNLPGKKTLETMCRLPLKQRVPYKRPNELVKKPSSSSAEYPDSTMQNNEGGDHDDYGDHDDDIEFLQPPLKQRRLGQDKNTGQVICIE